MQKVPSPLLSPRTQSFSGSLIELAGMAHPQENPMRRTVPRESNPLAGDGGLSAGDMSYAAREPRCHYRFAAGQVLPKPHIAAMFSMAYYTPGVLEMLESLVNPGKYDQTSLAWAVEVQPRHVGKPYWDACRELFTSGAVPMGILRAPSEDAEAGTPLPYVVAATPKAPLVLRRGDSVYALADREWAATHGVAAAMEETP